MIDRHKLQAYAGALDRPLKRNVIKRIFFIQNLLTAKASGAM